MSPRTSASESRSSGFGVKPTTMCGSAMVWSSNCCLDCRRGGRCGSNDSVGRCGICSADSVEMLVREFARGQRNRFRTTNEHGLLLLRILRAHVLTHARIYLLGRKLL